MKAKNHLPPTSELEAKEKLIVYVFEYLNHVGANKAAELFLEEIRYDKSIKLLNTDEKNAFLANWWFVFWDLYCAAPEKRANQPEPTLEGRTFYDFHIHRSSMSPGIMQTSPQPGPPGPPPPHYAMSGGPPSMYGPPPPPGAFPGHMRPMGNRFPQGGPLPRGQHYVMAPRFGPPPPSQMHVAGPAMQSSSPAPMMAMSSGSGPDSCGQSTGVNRMTPVGHGPPQPMRPVPSPSGQMMQHQGCPPMNSMPGPGLSPQSRPLQQQQQPQPQPQPQQPPPQQPQHQMQPQQAGWQQQQGNMNYAVNSPAPSYVQGPPVQVGPGQSEMGGMMMDVKNSPANDSSTPHSQDEYLMPSFASETDQNESAEIMKVKQSLQDGTKKYEEKSDFNLDYSDSQNKWSSM